MTAVSFGVLLLIALAILTAVLMVLAAVGRLPLGMEAPAPLHRRPPAPGPAGATESTRAAGATGATATDPEPLSDGPYPSDAPPRPAAGQDGPERGSAAGERPLPGARE